MGRIKTKQIKRITNDILKQHSENFKEDFNENKKKIVEYAKFPSKKLRNVISGYATRLTKNKEDL
jgi:ribosomal protein S17E